MHIMFQVKSKQGSVLHRGLLEILIVRGGGRVLRHWTHSGGVKMFSEAMHLNVVKILAEMSSRLDFASCGLQAKYFHNNQKYFQIYPHCWHDREWLALLLMMTCSQFFFLRACCPNPPRSAWVWRNKFLGTMLKGRRNHKGGCRS